MLNLTVTFHTSRARLFLEVFCADLAVKLVHEPSLGWSVEGAENRTFSFPLQALTERLTVRAGEAQAFLWADEVASVANQLRLELTLAWLGAPLSEHEEAWLNEQLAENNLVMESA